MLMQVLRNERENNLTENTTKITEPWQLTLLAEIGCTMRQGLIVHEWDEVMPVIGL